MPQITLEYTSNIEQPVDADELMKSVHELVARIVDLPIGNCKSRVNVCNIYRPPSANWESGSLPFSRTISRRPPALSNCRLQQRFRISNGTRISSGPRAR